jgi:hypothetical protein
MIHQISIINSFVNSSNPDDKIYDADDDLRVTKDITAQSFTSNPYTNNPNGFSVGEYLIPLASLDPSKAPPTPKFWNSSSTIPSDTNKAAAIDLADAISILKMIVGLNVNGNGTPLSPYQSLAADFNQNGEVGLDDAIGVLKKIVGLSSPEPEWKYFDESKIQTVLTSSESLNPRNWVGDAEISDLLAANYSVNVVGVLIGDVNGSWI